jgi:PAS domain S-box-containing protein
MNRTRVMIVEDAATVAQDLCRRLRNMDYQVAAVVASGEEAVEIAVELRPDIVLMDIRLAGKMDGVQAAAQIHARCDVPVVYLTAHVDEQLLQRAKITEPFGYIVKPAKEWELRSNIEITLYKHAQEQALRESEERFRSIYSQSPIAIELYDPEGLLIDANPACLDLFGVADVEAVKEFNLFEDPNVPGHAVERLLAGEAVKYESEFDFELVKEMGLYETTKSGRCLIDCLITPWIVEAGAPSGFLVHVRDITEQKQAEEALRNSREELRITLDATTDGIWTWNFETNELFFSPRYYTMLGYEPDEFPASFESWQNLIHPDDLEGAMTVANQWLQTKSGRYENEFRLKTKPGDYRWMYARGMVVEWDKNGQAVRMIGNHEDITGRKQAEEALRESEERYRELANSITDVFFAMDKNLRYTYWNRASEELTGIPAQDALGKSLYELFPDTPQTRRAEQVYRDVLSTQQPQTFVNEYQLEGRDFYFEISVYPSKDGISVFSKDVTERRRAEEQILIANERLQYLLASTSAVIYTAKPSDDYGATFISENVHQVSGYEAREFLEQPSFWIDHVHPEDVPRVSTEVPRVFEKEQHLYEYRFLHQDGTYRWMRDQMGLVRDEAGEPLEIIGFWIDITERKRAEEQTQASLREKEVLLKEVHHRVKNNLQVISSLLSLQSDVIQDPQIFRVFRESQHRVRSLALVHERLYQSPDLARVNAAEYVHGLVDYLLGAYGAWAGDVRLDVQVDDVPLSIDAAICCGLIINELISNALEHAFPADGEELAREGNAICVALRAGEGDQRTLVVGDNGVGLPPDLNWRDTPSLGLKLVSMLSQQLRGTVELDSSAGTTFKIAFADTFS